MSKIVQAVNAMISNPQLITKIFQAGSELFFLYKGKYKWSMRRDSDDQNYYLWYYPGNNSIESIASNVESDWEGVQMVPYNTKEIGTREALASFAELYKILKERLFGMHDVLEDIISDLGDQ